METQNVPRLGFPPRRAPRPESTSELSLEDCARLLAAFKEISYLRELEGLQAVVARWARELTGADGVTFVLRDGDHVYYAEEDAIAPLWKGRRFPASSCISGWAIQHRTPALIPDIYADARIPVDAYRPTFVKSLAMIPVREEDPIAAIGAYWAARHVPTAREVSLLQALANSTAVALANAELYLDAKRALQLRDEFIAIASHELKTPLTALRLQLHSLTRVAARGEGLIPAEPALGKLQRQADRLTQLVAQLLDVSTLGTARPQLAIEDADLAEIASGVVDSFRPVAEESGATVTFRADAPVPGAWDRMRIEQALGNLLSNAVKYAPKAPIEVEAWSRGACAVLTVTDCGPGIGEEDRSRIFGRFERAVSSRNYGGFGLGLYVAREIVAAHGGEIRVEDRTDGEPGAVFVIELPTRPLEAAAV